MRKLQFSLLFSCLSLFLAQINNPAKAAPIFARQTGFSCSVCHTPVFPRLNSFGWAFKENGFQVPNVDNTEAKSSTKIENNLELLSNIPLAFRITNVMEFKPSHKQLDFRLPSEVELISGGRIYKNVSFFVNQGLGTPFSAPPPMETGFVQVNNLFTADNSFNLRAGKFFLMDWYFSPMRNITGFDYLNQTANIGANNFNLASSQVGIEAYGRPLGGPVFYHLGVFNGNYDESLASAEVFDNNNYKDVFGGLKMNFLDNQSLGFFGYYGTNSVAMPSLTTKGFSQKSLFKVKAETATAPTPKVDMPYFSVGSALNFDLNPVPLQLLLMGSYSSNLDAQKDLNYGGFAELTYSFTPNLWDYEPTITPLVRYDMLSSKTGNKTSYDASITPSIQFLLLKNLILSFDYSINMYDHEKDSTMFRIQTAL